MEVNPVDPYQFDELMEKMMCEVAEERIDHQDHVFSDDFEFELQRKLRAKTRTSQTRQAQRNRIIVNSGSDAETVPACQTRKNAYKPFPKAYAIGGMAACLLLGAVLFRGWQGLREQIVLNEQSTPEQITESGQAVPEQSSAQVQEPAESQAENSFAAPTAEQQPSQADVPQEAILPALPDQAENISTEPAVPEKIVTVVTVLKTVTVAPVTTLSEVTTTTAAPVTHEPGDAEQNAEIPEKVYSKCEKNGLPADKVDEMFAEKTKKNPTKDYDYVFYCECEKTDSAFTADILTDVDTSKVSFFDAVPLNRRTLDVSPAMTDEADTEPGWTRYRNTVSGNGKYSRFVYRLVCEEPVDPEKPEQCIVQGTVLSFTVNGEPAPKPEDYIHPFYHRMIALGDVNGDNQVDVTDANLIIQYSGGSSVSAISDRGKLAADVNLDGIVDLDDAVQILTYIANCVPHVWGNC
ncbi:MAG: dockerin type I repeat-containing protein [Oscillospiraceae bacterium]|nr:dockerin type I repeat-containing protein [Oscillospiraceae bacterium]